MKIATWNVNSIKARLPIVVDWLGSAGPDVLLLQETKTTADDFPRFEFEALGYRCHPVGQRAYNGVAIISRLPIEDVVETLPGDDDDAQARYVEATVAGLRVASIYLPNGNPAPGDKYTYKLSWMRRLHRHSQALLDRDQPFVLAGDYNVIPTENDVYHPAGWLNDALYMLPTRQAFRTIVNLGLTDAFRAVHPGRTRAYTFWDYQAGRWQNDEGLRIDHILLSPAAADRLVACDIDTSPRARPKASDHTPVWCEIADATPGARFL